MSKNNILEWTKMNEAFLGNRLQELRERRKITSVQLAEISGVNQASISDLENNKRPKPSFITVKKLALALGVDPDYFYDENLTIPEVLRNIPIDLKDFMKEENIEYLYLARDLKNTDLSIDTIKEIISFQQRIKKKP